MISFGNLCSFFLTVISLNLAIKPRLFTFVNGFNSKTTSSKSRQPFPPIFSAPQIRQQQQQQNQRFSKGSNIICRDVFTQLQQTRSSEDDGNSGIIPLAQTGKSQLASAFTSLDETDQYDAVLTGLCAKILDTKEETSEEEKVSIDDPMRLLKEMNDRMIDASPRSLMSLIDATVTLQDAQTMAQVLSFSARNRKGITQYGILQTSVTSMPMTTAPSSASQRFSSAPKVVCPDGTKKTRRERLDSVSNVPEDDRSTEISSALVVAGIYGVGGITDLFGMDDISAYANIIIFAITTLGIIDNFYDVLSMGTKFIASQTSSGEDKKGQKVEFPDKESLPLSLGSGKITGTVVRGFTRLISTDTERECECEAAAFYTAYTLGLPCFAFQPNAFEGAALISDSIKTDVSGEKTTSAMNSWINRGTSGKSDSLLSTSGILKVLIWIMAPVAMESMKYPQLVSSDPREGDGFLQRLKEAASLDEEKDEILLSICDENDDQAFRDLIKWAYTEADVILRNNIQDVTKVSERLTGGAATIGDCVAAIENW